MERIYRKELTAFMLAAETLLSPILLTAPLTSEERKIVEFYVKSLVERFKEAPQSANS